MTGLVRTLPIRVLPVTGEALDSWIEAIAARLDTPVGGVLTHLGLVNRATADRYGRDWTVGLRPDEADDIAAATGVHAATLHRLTLTHYNGRALLIDEATGRVNRSVLWGRGRGSRFCPNCLAANGGRWMLEWRLPWYFACIDHQRMLADGCPGCARTQRQRWISRHLVPRPGHCHQRRPTAEQTPMERCNEDLSTSATLRMPTVHPCLAAQQLIHTVIDTGSAEFGIYAPSPRPADHVLADVRALSLRLLSSVPAHFHELLPKDVVNAHRSTQVDTTRQRRPGFMAPPHAATAAVAITAAVHILAQDNIAAAAAAMHEALQEIGTVPAMASATSVDDWSNHTSPELKSVYLAALGPSLRPRFQLRYRTATAVPSRTLIPAETLSRRAAKLPSMLWPAWAIRIGPRTGTGHQTLRSILPVMVLLVGSDLDHSQAIGRLGSVATQLNTVRILQRLQKDPQWEAIHTALVRLADLLDSTNTPIDYDRRRNLDYTELLDDDRWARIARASGIAKGHSRRARLTRNVLFQKLSGLPAGMAPPSARLYAGDAPTDVAHLAVLQTLEVTEALKAAGEEFLTAHGINDEPLEWQPSIEVLDGLSLPGPDLRDIDPSNLHELIHGQRLSLHASAERLGTTFAAIHFLLDRNPAPSSVQAGPEATSKRSKRRNSSDSPQQVVRRTTQQARREAREALPVNTLRKLYEEERRTLGQIAAISGFSLKIIRRLAHDYGLEIRGPEDYRRHGVVDRGWLYEQYVIQRRTLPDLAREKGMSTMNMNRWAHQLGIPLRPRGGASTSRFLHQSE